MIRGIFQCGFGGGVQGAFKLSLRLSEDLTVIPFHKPYENYIGHGKNYV